MDFSPGGAVLTSRPFVNLQPLAVVGCMPDTEGDSNTVPKTAPRNLTACQILANLCTLRRYEQSSEACREYGKILANEPEDVRSGLHGFSAWPQRLPWLDYNASSRPEFAEDLKMIASAGDMMRIVAAVYTLHGEYLGLKEITTDWNLCAVAEGKKFVDDAVWRSYGTSYSEICSIDFGELGTPKGDSLFSANLFYEPYFVDDNFGMAMYPIPVELVENDGFMFGDEKYKSTERVASMHRRFFLVDSISGYGSSGDTFPKAIRVARRLNIAFRTREEGKMYPPFVQVEYEDIEISGPTVKNRIQFQVIYASENSDLRDVLPDIVIAVCIIAGLLSTLKIRAERRRDNKVEVDAAAVFAAADIFGSAFANIMFFMLSAIGIYYVVWSKPDARTFPPRSEIDDFMFQQCLYAAASLKFFQIAAIIYKQCTTDVFLIDWEKPQNSGNASGTEIGGIKRAQEVSLWRMILIANEFNELQCYRKVPFEHLLVIIFTFLLNWDAAQLASQNPMVVDGYIGEDSRVLRFGVAAILYISITAVLWVLYKIFYRIKIEEKMGQFEDLCSVSNISVFMLTHRYYGFYIHGRSVHGFADVGLKTMKTQMRREKSDLTGRRGLISDTDEQCFQIHVPEAIRTQWDSIFLNLVNESAIEAKNGGTTGDEQYDNNAAAAYKTINDFLIAYINHSFKEELDYVVKEKGHLQRLLSTVPAITTVGTFYTDRSRKWTSTMFYGEEANLIAFEFFIFVLVDWETQSWYWAITTTYIVAYTVKYIRSTYGAENITRKTLIAKEFLI